tara:strand:- start:5283 stop:5957 length:675 start_codon:yes stop_codon:yes gene_type:complete
MERKFYNEEENTFEIGVDEVGRGPMFGRVYTAAVILPKDGIDYSLFKDSKKFTSFKKLKAVSEYIKEHALYWSINYESEEVIDKINIRQATFSSMHKSIAGVLKKMYDDGNSNKVFLLIDGTDFKPYKRMKDDNLVVYEHECVKGGDAEYSNIAAASILAKVERDEYILDMCEKYPKLKEYYSLDSNKGYGAKIHLEGIKTYGITKWHRKSFGCCKFADIINIE